MNIEKKLYDVCLDLLIVRKHVYIYNCNRLFKAADHIHMGVRTCTVYTGESTEAVRHEW
jgi:hypothetical protein